ncbi:MAG: hypothetical protein AAFQ80_21140 [Cyanobacteria bacterium J06621_8]
MLQAWLFGVAILFVLAEFSIWLKQFMVSLPIYILAGAFLAIASNYDSGLIASFRKQIPLNSEIITQEATLVETKAALTATKLNQQPESRKSSE